jgi:outer membrane receptor protein involved in Fe transport
MVKKRMIKLHLLLFLLLLTFSMSGFTQGVSLSGIVVDRESKEPLPGATISLNRQENILSPMGTVTDTSGIFELKAVPDGSYLLEVRFIGFETLKLPFTVSGKNMKLPALLLVPSEILLGEATILGRQSTLVNELDKKVYNVSQDIMAESSSVSEIMQNIPSISVDINGNITLRNSGNITFFINGRPSAMLRRAPGTVLQQMPANSIGRIEIITNPSARYRPDGVGGIINIVLKKEAHEGLNGQLTANAGTENRYNGNVILNYASSDFKLFGNDGLRHNSGSSLHSDERIYKDSVSGLPVSNYNEIGSSFSNGWSHNLFAGGRYDVNDYNSIELSGSLFLQKSIHTNLSEIEATNASGDPDYSFTDHSINNEREQEGEASLTYDHVFKKNEDHSLSFEATYSAYNESEDLKFNQAYSFPDDHVKTGSNLIEKSGTQEEILLDYILPIGEDAEFESGYSGEFVHDNIKYTGETSTRFIANSQVHALYALYGMPLEDFSFKAGLRAEQALIGSHLIFPTDTLIPNNYFKLFPTLHLAYTLNDNNEFSMSYSKRINRADPDELNPYMEFSDPRNAEAGNPKLKPEQIHSIEMGYQRHYGAGDLTGTLYYRYRYDAFTTIYSTIADTVVLRTAANLNTQDALGLELVLSGDILKNWKIDLTGNLFHTTIDATDLGYSLKRSTISGNIKLYSLLTFWRKTFLQINAFYYFPTITPQGRRDPNFYMNTGIKQQLFNNKASLTLTVSDVFHTYRRRSEIASDQLNRINTSSRKLPVIYLGFTWRLNNFRDTQKLEYEGEGRSF